MTRTKKSKEIKKEFITSEDTQELKKVQNTRKAGLIDVARALLRPLLERYPNNGSLKFELALIHMDGGENREALAVLEQLIRTTTGSLNVWLALGKVNQQLGNKAKEIDCLRRALAIRKDPRALRHLLNLYRQIGNYQEAEKLLCSLRKEDKSIKLTLEYVDVLIKLGQSQNAIAECEVLIQLEPAPYNAVEKWVSLMLDAGLVENVITRLESLIESGRKEAPFYAGLGRAYSRFERVNEAIEAYKHATEIDDAQKGWWHDFSVLERQMGDIKRSQISLNRSLDLDPYNAAALRVYGVEHKYTYGQEEFKRLNIAHAYMDKYSPAGKVQLHYALGKMYEDVGELASAFAHYEEGGRIQTQLFPYYNNKAVSLFKLMHLKMRHKQYEGIEKTGCISNKSVFVLGMPRSGTSLIEQIIASHPEAYGAGELKLLHRVIDGLEVNGMTVRTKEEIGTIRTFIPGVSLDCQGLDYKQRGERYIQAIEALAGTVPKKIVDKMPGNYYWAGLIPLILPNARIIHSRRHPVETLLSNYRIYFPDGIPWSYDLRDLGKAYRAYHDHMKYWEQVLPAGHMINVRYEDLVNDLGTQARHIISHCELEWDDKCLKFYETERPVKTASLSQVRKPIYKTSTNRWHKYESYLKPLIEELGPLIKEYEDELKE